MLVDTNWHKFAFDAVLSTRMTSRRIRERLAETEERVDSREYVEVLQYVRGN